MPLASEEQGAQQAPVSATATDGQKLGRACVVLPARCPEMERELRAMIVEELGAIGFDAIGVNECDSAILDAQLVLSIADCYRLEHMPRMLLRLGPRRPRTILWQFHPLPPASMAQNVVRAGLAIGTMHERLKLPDHAWGRAVGRVVSESRRRDVHRRTYVAATRPLFHLARLGLRHCDDPELRRLHFGFFKEMFLRSAWLRYHWKRGWIDLVAASTRVRADFLNRQGIPAMLAPLGGHSQLGSDLGRQRDLPVVFLGRVWDQRRSQLLAAVQKDLATAGVKVEVVGDQCYGQDRTGLLNRARIVLHLHNFAWDPPWLRLLLATSCGAMMVSEPIADNSLYQPGIHFIHAPINQLAATILHYLENESERKKIVQTAQKFVSTEVTLQASVRAMVNHVLSLPDR